MMFAVLDCPLGPSHAFKSSNKKTKSWPTEKFDFAQVEDN